MQNEIEKLMRPRFEVIAPYPFSPYKVGDIIEKIAKLNWRVKQRPVSCLSEDDPYAPYPHLFRELKWWEKRGASEMPKYMRFEEGGVVKVKEFTDVVRFGKFKCEETTIELFIANANPATEAEYEKWKTKS